LRTSSFSTTRSLFPPQAKSLDKGHGRIESRRIFLSSKLKGYADFPHVGTTFHLERNVTDLAGKNARHEVAYGLTSISGTDKRAGERLLGLVRGHWEIENGLHWRRDTTYDEDRSQIRKGNGPRVMATLRNLAISILRIAGADAIASATRRCCVHIETCLRLIGLK
jgi:predicted transposase YbfD/YdcC